MCHLTIINKDAEVQLPCSSGKTYSNLVMSASLKMKIKKSGRWDYPFIFLRVLSGVKKIRSAN